MSNVADRENDFRSKGTGTDRPMQDVKDKYQDLRADVAGLTESVKRLAEKEIGPAVSDIKETAEQGYAKFESQIRKNPTQAALIAAGVGFVIGLIASR